MVVKTYIIVGVSDYKDANGSKRTVHCGEAMPVVAGAAPMTPMISYSFDIVSPSADDLAAYDFDKKITLSVAPAAE